MRRTNAAGEEFGQRANYVSKILGHTTLTTTSRYLNIHRRQRQLAMQRLKQHQAEHKAVAQALHNADEPTPAVVQDSDDHPAGKSLPS